MVETVGQIDIGELDASYYWRRSLTCGVLAARFADVLAPRLREEAFISGLLSDVGITILAQEMADDYAPVLNMYKPHGRTDLAEAEMDALGVTHAEMSAVVLEFWKLPELICQAVANHQSDVAANTEAIQLARIINAADRIAKLLCESPDLEHLAQECQAAVAFVDLDLSVLLEMIDKVEADVSELAHMLKLNVVAGSVYSLIAKAIKEHVSV
jgi:HD-like signal output (HDOD) protein